MNKGKIILILASTLLILPLVTLAQLDFDFNGLFENLITEPNDVVISNLDLNWSADTYTPYNYSGRSLPSRGSKIIVEAMVKTSKGEADNLKYSWFLDTIFQGNNSGYGRNSFSFYVLKGPGNYHEVNVQIFNEERTTFEERSIKIPVVSPEIIIYLSDGDSYFSDQAKNTSVIFSDKKFSFVGKPYFFSIKKLSDLSFEWRFVNQQPIISSAYDANVLDVTINNKTNKELLEDNLWLDVTNKDNFKQRAFKTINVQIY